LNVAESSPDDLDDWIDDILESVKELVTIERKRAALQENIDGLNRLLKGTPNDIDGLREALHVALAPHESELHDLAVRLRENWARTHRERLARTCADAIEILRTRRSFRNISQDTLTDLQSLFPVWGCTLLSLGNAIPFHQNIVERLVIDEAGQCHPAYAISGLYRARRALLIGDEFQLEPVIHLDRGEENRVLRRLSQPSIDSDFRTSAQDHCSAIKLASRRAVDVPVLRDHFRCQAPIIDISNTLCSYGLIIRTPLEPVMHPLLPHAIVGLDISGVQTPYLGSWRNMQEVDALTRLITRLLSSGISPGRIAVLTPYRGQLRALDDALKRAGVPLFEANGPDQRDGLQGVLFDLPTELVVSGTVHRFQGGERDIVLFSTVVTEDRSMPFLNERENLLNVAVSRARRHLVVIGDRSRLSTGTFTQKLQSAVAEWLPSTLD